MQAGDKPRIASVDDPMIAAITGGQLRLASQKQAATRLALLHKTYLRAKDQEAGSLKLWIRGFAVTPEEESQGYSGHFARITVVPVDSGRFTLRAEKLIVDISRHPQKARPRERHPNWGHPIMRAVETGKQFASIEVARTQLILLHEEYPEATLPGNDKLHVMVYNRRLLEGDNANPIQKITLSIKALEGGKAKLVSKKSTPRKPAAPKEQAPAKGKFTAMLKQRSKKKPK